MNPKFKLYESITSKGVSLEVDTGFYDSVEFDVGGDFLPCKLSKELVEELVDQLSTWLGYKAMENG